MPVLKEQAAKPGDSGADAVILLSIMRVDADREIAAVMQAEAEANPAVANMCDAKLMALERRGLDPEFATDKHETIRDHARGLMHVSGACIRDG